MRILPALFLAAAAAAPAPPQDDEKGFEPLFNGKDFTGLGFHLMEADADPAKTFSVEDGALSCNGKPFGYAYTEKKFGEFTLRFDWKYKRPADLKEDKDFKGNSGILLFVNEHRVWPYGVEIHGKNSQVALPIFLKPKEVKKNTFKYDPELRKKTVKPVGEWNTEEIVARDGRIMTSVNGVLLSTVTEHEYKDPGHIGFQSEGGEICWRNIRIKPD